MKVFTINYSRPGVVSRSGRVDPLVGVAALVLVSVNPTPTSFNDPPKTFVKKKPGRFPHLGAPTDSGISPFRQDPGG